MKYLAGRLMVVCLFSCTLYAQTGSNAVAASAWQEPENHTIEVDRLFRYHDSGEYQMQIREVANAARDYLEERFRDSQKERKLAAVFDIDETALSNWAAMSDCGFCSYRVEKKLYTEDHDPAITPVLELFNYAKKNGIHVFFLTGRQESERTATIRNLNEAGYSGWEELIMRPDNDKDPARVFKPEERRKLEDKGYRIILNIGDQASDLSGCCAERVFKLPNPFYLIP
jgi:acid phosphatase